MHDGSRGWRLGCDCGVLTLEVRGAPIVSAYCHCRTCRLFYGVDIFSASAWHVANIALDQTAPVARFDYQHRRKQMARSGCARCGRVLHGQNALGYIVIPNTLFRAGGRLPAAVAPRAHFFYGQRVIGVNDGLPKYFHGRGGAYSAPASNG